MSSIRDVARLAGVAACTVSRVLNGTAGVAPETKLKIEQAMKELDYVPNELARGMFLQKSGIIAMLVPSIKHPFFSSLADFIEKELYDNGYKLMLCSTSGDIQREREYLTMFKSNLVDGVIMAVNSLEVKDYLSFQKPMIMLDYAVDKKIPFVVSDHKMGGRLAAEEFIKNGCHFVLHLCAEKEEKEVLSYESHRELEEILTQHGIRTRNQEIKWNNFELKDYRKLAELILQSYPEIDGVMAADMSAAAFYDAAKKLGRRIPEELSIVAYDGTYVTDLIDAEMTAVVQHLDKISREVAGQLFRLLNRKPGEKGLAGKRTRGRAVSDNGGVFVPVSLRKGSTT